MTEKPKILFLFILVIASCKYLPNQTRTTGTKISSERIYNTKNIEFKRNTNFTAGTLTFEIDSNYTCEVSYWTDNPNVTPNKSSPIIYNCPETKNGKYEIYFTDLSLSDSYNFEIASWPKGLDRGLSIKHLFKEDNKNLDNIEISDIYVIQYNHQTKSMKLSYLKPEVQLNFKELKSEISSEISKTCEVSNYLKNSILRVNKVPIKTIWSDGFLSTDRSSQYRQSKFLKLKNLDIRQDWTLGFEEGDLPKSILLPKPQYIKAVSIKNRNENKELVNYSFLGKIKDTKIESSNTKLQLDLIENKNTDTIVNTKVNNKLSCKKHSTEPIDIYFGNTNNNLTISTIKLDWLYSSILKSPVLFINTDQFITTISI